MGNETGTATAADDSFVEDGEDVHTQILAQLTVLHNLAATATSC
jgi:hypothetical protein